MWEGSEVGGGICVEICEGSEVGGGMCRDVGR